jgi:hypothetical protein
MTTVLPLNTNGNIASKDAVVEEHPVEEQASEHFGNWPNDAGVG